MVPVPAWRKARPLAGLTVVALLVVPAFGPAHDKPPAPPPPVSTPAASADVTVDDNTFTAATVDVEPGATVTWHWAPGSSTHTVTADPGQAEAFDTTQSTGTFTHTFTHEGRFTYVCRRHSSMQGVVIVRAPSATPDTTPPATPTGLAATAGDRSLALDWADVAAPDLAGYRVERQNLDGSWTTVGETTASAYTDAGLTNGAAYAYRVSAYDIATPRNESAPSAPAPAPPAAPATAPSERTVTIGDYAYGPADVVVNRGDTVVWSWTGPDVNHTVTSAPGSAEPLESHPGVADSAVTGAPAGGYRHTFTSIGTFSYLCRVHPDGGSPPPFPAHRHFPPPRRRPPRHAPPRPRRGGGRGRGERQDDRPPPPPRARRRGARRRRPPGEGRAVPLLPRRADGRAGR